MANGGDVQTTTVQTDDTPADTETQTTVLTDDQSTDTDDTNSDASADDAGADNTGDKDDTGGTDGEGGQTSPDTYADFVMPEGATLDESVLSEATPIFKELGLNQEQAQKLVDFHAAQVQAGSQKQVDAFNQQLNDWRESSSTDKEFGGDAFEENVKIAQAAVNNFGTPELKQLLEDYGVGNHPEVIRFMVKVGKLTAEDVPGGSGNATETQGDRVSRLYPNDRNK